MRTFVRWSIATISGAVTFATSWWVCEVLMHLPTDTAIGISAIPAGLAAGPLGWWAGRNRTHGSLSGDVQNSFTGTATNVLQAGNVYGGVHFQSGDPAEFGARSGRTDFDYSAYLSDALSLSRSRIMERWRVTGLSEDRASAFLDNEKIGRPENVTDQLPHAGFLLIEGEFGTGKSLVTERIHQDDVKLAIADGLSPVPVWLDARDIRTGRSLYDTVTLLLESIVDVRSCGVRLVIDGLDEGTMVDGRDLIGEARVLSRTWAQSRVIVTARPGFVVADEEKFILPLLDEQEVRALFEAAGGSYNLLSNDSRLRDAVRRPLFALIAADLQQSGSDLPRSEGSFLDSLVERALERSRAHDGTRELLTTVARLTMGRSGSVPVSEVGPDDVVSRVLDTRLIRLRGRALSFSLPIIEQYFAGRALLDSDVMEELCDDIPALHKWRYAIVIALTIGSWQKCLQLVTRLAAKLPGLAAWAVHEAIPSTGVGYATLPSSVECARSIQTALALWIETLRPISGIFGALVRDDGSLMNVVARTTGPRLLLAIDSRSSGDPAQEMLERIDFLRPPSYITYLRAGEVPSDYSAWPWRLSLELVAKSLGSTIATQVLPLDKSSPGTAERKWQIGRALLGDTGYLRHDPMDADKLLSVAASALSAARRQGADGIAFGRAHNVSASVDELTSFIEDIRSGCMVSEDGMVHRPYIVPDNDTAGGRWVWDSYSIAALEILAEQIYAAALVIYQQLVERWFAPLRPTLGLGSTLPIRIDMALKQSERPTRDIQDGPVVVYEMFPISDSEASFVRFFSGDPESALPAWDSPDSHEQRLRFLRSRPGGLLGWESPMRGWSAFDAYGDTPATDIAYKWLKGDLYALHMTNSR